jgi:hypothetical protein
VTQAPTEPAAPYAPPAAPRPVALRLPCQPVRKTSGFQGLLTLVFAGQVITPQIDRADLVL